MNVLVYLVPMALALGLTGSCAFLWSMRAGQYDDLDGAALRVLSTTMTSPRRVTPITEFEIKISKPQNDMQLRRAAIRPDGIVAPDRRWARIIRMFGFSAA